MTTNTVTDADIRAALRTSERHDFDAAVNNLEVCFRRALAAEAAGRDTRVYLGAAERAERDIEALRDKALWRIAWRTEARARLDARLDEARAKRSAAAG